MSEFINNNFVIGEVKQLNMANDYSCINVAYDINSKCQQSDNEKKDTKGKVEIFLSYCHKDDYIANEIEQFFNSNQKIKIHRDKIDIGIWKSVKEYMQSITDMDYVIFLISDSFLKSENCLYEVMETMRERKYRNKIFPAVIHNAIYAPIVRADYVIYWQRQYSELKDKLEGIQLQNIGKLGEDLKRRQNIAANIADFLDCVADMNNPAIEDVCKAIEEKLEKVQL